MDGTAFDSLGFSKKLIQAGFSQGQAEALANLTTEMENFRKAEHDKLEAVRKAEQDRLEAERRKTLATKADIMAVKADIEKVRAELKLDIEKVRADIEKVRADTKDAEMRLLKWQIGIGVALVAVMAKGFGWLGF